MFSQKLNSQIWAKAFLGSPRGPWHYVIYHFSGHDFCWLAHSGGVCSAFRWKLWFKIVSFNSRFDSLSLWSQDTSTMSEPLKFILRNFLFASTLPMNSDSSLYVHFLFSWVLLLKIVLHMRKPCTDWSNSKYTINIPNKSKTFGPSTLFRVP